MTDTSTALRECLLTLAELKEECGLDLQLGKCKLYIKGMALADARALVRSVINAEPRWSSISEKLQVREDQSKNVIQVDRIMFVGMPIDLPVFVKVFVRNKTWSTMLGSHGQQC